MDLTDTTGSKILRINLRLMSATRRGPVVRKLGMKPTESKWVWAKKSDGRYKARVVALGFLQQYGINFFETYADVASMNFIRLLFSDGVHTGDIRVFAAALYM